MDGTYNIVAHTPIGAMNGSFTLETVAEGLSVKVVLTGNDLTVSGTRDGDAFAFDCTLNAAGMDVAMRFEGTAKDGKLDAKANTGYGPITVEGALAE